DCPAWDLLGHRRPGRVYGSGPPECCAVPFGSIKGINLTKLQCEGYSSAYSLAPLRINGPDEWAYGIRVKYTVQANEDFCRACQATGGTCGYGTDGVRQLCMCGTSNSTSTCDFVMSSLSTSSWKTWAITKSIFAGSLMLMLQ
ncbi:uncharacterized protein LOC111008993, partial [Momordica charantia]|uniref:Uncharacterized protein LOC111008993 n=1 Tax=Momordica charantia TaxID=3673 RepID=A0A6J1CAQ0_MOMCH